MIFVLVWSLVVCQGYLYFCVLNVLLPVHLRSVFTLLLSVTFLCDRLAHNYSSAEHFPLGLHYTGDEGVLEPAKMATLPYLGCMSEDKPETKWVSAYLERMDIFLRANEFPEKKTCIKFFCPL